MATRSIYHKACPSCAALVQLEATQCACGYSFEAQIYEAEPLPEDLTAQEEELLTEYLHARIGQAVADLESIQSVLAADPKNLDKAHRLMKAHVALYGLRAELNAQSAKTHAAKRAALEARRERGWEIDDAATTPSAEPTETFRAAQSHKAEQIMKAAGMDTKECPKCHAVMPERAALCFCGFAFIRGGADVPRPVAAPGINQRKNL